MTSTRTGNRRSHLRLEPVILVSCVKCKSPIRPHEVCKVCGYYGDQQVIDMNKKENKIVAETDGDNK